MSDLIERMRSLEQDHAPDGWPAVQMRDISALCDLVEVERACGAGPVGYTNWSQLAYIKTVGEGAVYSDTDHGCDIALYTQPQPAQQGSVLDGFSEFVSAVRSINRSSHHAIQIPGDDQPCFWQRKEWIDWIFELADKVEVAVQRALEATRMEAESRRPMFSTPTTPQPEGDGWVRCEDRLPTEADGSVVWSHDEVRETVELVSWAWVQGLFKNGHITHWKPTGLKRPQPPAGQEGSGDE